MAERATLVAYREKKTKTHLTQYILHVLKLYIENTMTTSY